MFRRVDIFLFLFLMTVAFPSCTECYMPDVEGHLVVEGWIEDGRAPVVIVTLSVPTAIGEISFDDLGRYVVRRAKVTVSDGTQTTILTGKADKNYLSQYIYTTSHLHGEMGKEYVLTVTYDDFSATAVTSIPRPVHLDDVTPKRIEGGEGSYSLVGHFTDDRSTKDYYKFFSMVEGKETVYSSSLYGTVSDDSIGQDAAVEFYSGSTIDGAGFHPYFSSGETVRVKLCTMTEESFHFWKDFDDLVSLSRSPLFSITENPSSNMSGAYGYWAGYGASYTSVTIPE